MVIVAQLVESRIVIPVVAGSSPVVHPNKFNYLVKFNRVNFIYWWEIWWEIIHQPVSLNSVLHHKY